MSILTIDTFTDSLVYSEHVPLEGIEYVFSFAWSDREACWYWSLADQDEVPIVDGIKLVINRPLLRRFVGPSLPRGMFMCVDLSGANADIVAPGDLGARVPFLYVTSDDPLIVGRSLRRPL